MWVPGAVVRQRPPTPKGFVFISVEDEDGLMNVIVKPDVYGRYYKVLRNCFLLIVEATIQRQSGILNVLAEGTVAEEEPSGSSGPAEGSLIHSPIHVLRESAILPPETPWLLLPIRAPDPCGDIAHNGLSPCFVQ